MKLFAGLRLGAQKEAGREGEGVPSEGVGWLVRARLGLQSHKKRTADGCQKSHGRKGEEQPLLREGRRETKPGLRTNASPRTINPPSFSILHPQKPELDSDLGSQKHGGKRRRQENLPPPDKPLRAAASLPQNKTSERKGWFIYTCSPQPQGRRITRRLQCFRPSRRYPKTLIILN